MKIAFLLYPVSDVRIDEDSSFWVIHELLRRGHVVHYFESKDLFYSQGTIQAFLKPTRTDSKKGYLPSPPAAQPTPLRDLDCVFIRKEPPFDNEYLHTLQLLTLIRDKVFVLNDPRGVMFCNEKLFTLEFPELIPETLVSENPKIAERFVLGLGQKVVIKPLHEKSGLGIVMSNPRDKNLPSLLQIATQSEKRQILVQRYVDGEKFGDKRILILNGEPIGAFLRKPPAQDFRANLSVGGRMLCTTLTPRDRQITKRLAPALLQHGLHFVGIDVIGSYLTEINVTSPAGIPECQALYGAHLEKKVVDFLESSVGGRSRLTAHAL